MSDRYVIDVEAVRKLLEKNAADKGADMNAPIPVEDVPLPLDEIKEPEPLPSDEKNEAERPFEEKPPVSEKVPETELKAPEPEEPGRAEPEENALPEKGEEAPAPAEDIDGAVELRMAERKARRSRRGGMAGLALRKKPLPKEEKKEPETGDKAEAGGERSLPWMASAIVFLLVFAVSTAVLVPLRSRGDSSVVVGVVDAVTSTEEGEEELIFTAEERLSSEMAPIAIDEGSPFYEAFMSSDRVNVMVLGVNQNMTDTIMVGSYDMENQTMDIISIPRDTFWYRSAYANASYGFHKINSVYRTEGVTKLAEAVSSLLYGMPIHYYAIVEYEDIRKVMDAVGGVEVDVPFHMLYEDTTPGEELHIDIPEGLQTIDSSNVIEFLRFRHTNSFYAAKGYQSYQRGDIDRIEVQQSFVKAFIKKCLNLGNLKEVATVTLENVESDMTYTMAAKIAVKALSGFDLSSMNSVTLPGIDKTINELSFWVADEDATYAMVESVYRIGTEEESDAEGSGEAGGETENTNKEAQ